jgi:hypothetical protein
VAEKYTSRVALILDGPIDDVGAVLSGAKAAGDLDRAYPVRNEGDRAQEVHWGGTMDKGVVRYLVDGGDHLLRTEAYIGSHGLVHGLQRQVQLVQALSRQVKDRFIGIRDLSAMTDRDEAWMNRLAIGMVEQDDAIVPIVDGEGTWWVRTHGAARFDVPDLELYGLKRAQTDAAVTELSHVHAQLLRGGLKADLALTDGTPVYLVPVLEAWQHVPLDWPGVGRAGQERGEGLDGPRASLSILRKPRFGRHKRDLEGVVDRLPTT